VAGFKSSATKCINMLRNTSGAPVWQRNYYEHIIRNEEDYEQIFNYNRSNPSNCAEDRITFSKPESRLPKFQKLRKSAGGDGRDGISSPYGEPHPRRKTHLGRCVFLSGDGGNRTRVRKTRPSEIYERSRLGMSPQVTQPANLTCSQPLGPESPLSRNQRHHARHSTFVSPNPLTGWRTVRVDAASLRRPADQLIAYAARGIAA